MSTVVIASSVAEAAAVSAIEEHHAEMGGALLQLVEALIVRASAGDEQGGRRATEALLSWCDHDLVPHALAEERALYPLAHGLDEGRLLVEGMVAEHGAILAVLAELRSVGDVVRAAAAARALLALFETHVAKENELLVPLVVAAPRVSLADALGHMHQEIGQYVPATDTSPAPASACGGHTCDCGETPAAGHPELDARLIPHAIRHATIFGALDGVSSGDGLVLVAPHDPLPLIAQVQERSDQGFEVSYVESGPAAWRVLFVRR